GEFAFQALVRLANAAVANRQPGLAANLERVAGRLSDELDEEEAINFVAGFRYTGKPCPGAPPAHVPPAAALRANEPPAPTCRRQADVRLSALNARRIFMWNCLQY